MIAAIGYEDDIIGMGLAGVTKLIELTPNASKQELLAAYKQAQGAQAIIMRSEHKERIQEHITDFIITIPEDTNDKHLAALTKEVLGITL